MMPSHSPIFLCTPPGCLLLSLRLGATQGQSALGRAFTFPFLSPGDAVLVLWRAAQPHLPTAINLALQCSSCWKYPNNFVRTVSLIKADFIRDCNGGRPASRSAPMDTT